MENMNKKEYQKYSEKKVPKPTYLKNIIFAFLVGGAICTIGQFLRTWMMKNGLDEKAIASGTSIILVFLGALLTGLGVYDEIGKIGGAGAAVPITGFSNAVVSPAMEFKTEGFIFGVASKMFTIAGPVLVYGVGSSVIVGILHLLFTKGR
ncbi:stage V sporulation protein AC [Tissierella praeacuta]|uniref:Stage V sporulation protein AC n=1 Tax=Tissierella praeacuta DSM 18095 TaxID=1123404 RepID=A0A1M4SX82_9FIRM|nr:stage V sporulation protein AC [Tissierella praeacuta]MBU5254604.1 stage V sporulation protein AC [Tissierella praeacuta]TCU70740.1 stage V sporulation protein AC [Tissierella praeacuta]SHE36759.1 stage V sporulation protein AC [Tissierella praeacuta DSM 18095]SUP01853.1 stage V sporulation protein AC [Tissierella praeacuta]